MISGNDFKGLFECGYLDANLQNAEDMTLNCIKDKSKILFFFINLKPFIYKMSKVVIIYDC